MYALCIESSHARGMGHFYRGLNLAEALQAAGNGCIFYLNEHEPSCRILAERGWHYRIIDLRDTSSDWPTQLIRQDNIEVWVNDRLDTNLQQAQVVKANGIPLVTFDDRGQGAALADLHIAALAFDLQEALAGAVLLRGADYLILNPQVTEFARERQAPGSILVTLGGSDTYGVTVKVVTELKSRGLGATIVIGPGFAHADALAAAVTPAFTVKHGVPSLIEEFSLHELAITGGGITPFEANATGLPCIVVANEQFEIPVCLALQDRGGAVFAGHHELMQLPTELAALPLADMSRAGMRSFGPQGTQRVVAALQGLRV
jgi:spore coat polysaccharide biosynthesis predicted glycosyltransferase SpsG